MSRLSLWQAQRGQRVPAGHRGQFEPDEDAEPIKLRETGRPAGMPVPEGGLIRCCPPARKGLLPCLCTNMWMTCAQWRRTCAYAVEMLGIPLSDCNRNRASTWGSAHRLLWIRGILELSTCRAAK